MLKNSYQWILSDVNIIRCRKTDITEFCLMLISSDAEKTTTIQFYLFKFCLMIMSSGAEKPELFKFLWCLYEQMQKNRYHRILSDVNIIRCRKTGIIKFCLMLISSDAVKTGIIKFCLMLISSDAVKRDTMEFSLMLISSDAANRRHWILSDVNVVRCRKAAIIECHEMLTSSDAEKSCHEILTALTDTGQQLSMNILWC